MTPVATERASTPFRQLTGSAWYLEQVELASVMDVVGLLFEGPQTI